LKICNSRLGADQTGSKQCSTEPLFAGSSRSELQLVVFTSRKRCDACDGTWISRLSRKTGTKVLPCDRTIFARSHAGVEVASVALLHAAGATLPPSS
jgi:hypothetical protein